jgi:hypothetical protein
MKKYRFQRKIKWFKAISEIEDSRKNWFHHVGYELQYEDKQNTKADTGMQIIEEERCWTPEEDMESK